MTTDAETPPADAPAPRSRRRRLLRSLLLGGFFLTAGLAGAVGMQLAGGASDGPVIADGPTLPQHDSMTHGEPIWVAPPLDEPQTDLEKIDRALQSGDFAGGLKRCRAVPRAGHAADDGPLDYREGLSLEGQAQWAEAAEAYRKAAEARPDGSAWAMLGQARCAAADGDPEAAHRLLNELVLGSGRSGADRVIVEECLYLRGRLALLGLRPAEPEPLDPDALAWPPAGGGIDVAILHLSSAPDEPPAARWGPPAPDAFPVTRHGPPAPVADVVAELAASVGLSVKITPEAAASLADKTAAVDVEAFPLSEVLTSLTEPHELGWRIEHGSLVLAPAGKPTPEAAASMWQRALVAAPNHPAARAARVWLANLDALAGRLRAAGAEYKRLLEVATNTPESLAAAYNLGLAELRLGNLSAARTRFLDVVDRQPGSRWADLGWWGIGRSHLNAGDAEDALRPLRTALGSRHRDVSSAAVLGLAAAHLLLGDELEARRVLREHRLVADDTHLATAAMLEALLRYRLNPTGGRRTILETALRDAHDGEALGPAGVFLAGQGYHAIGLPDRMVAVYDAAAERYRGPLVIRMTFACAERFNELDRRAIARGRYLAVAAADPAGLGAVAELRAADLDARDGKGAECVARCRTLLDRPGVDRSELLSVLGRGYELERDYRKAAEAFAGRVPEE